MPARSPGFLPVIPPFMMRPLVVISRAMSFLEAGPWQDAVPCSQMEHVTRLAATETPEPLLVPRGTRAVSYGLQACPGHGAYCRSFSGTIDIALFGPGAVAGPTLFAEATA